MRRHPRSVLSSFRSTAAPWQAALDAYSDEHFGTVPAPGQWSIGQVYAHLVGGTRRYHLERIDTCLGGGEGSGGKTMPGRIVFLLGSFPPVRVRVPPSPRYTPVQPAGRNAVRADLQQLIEVIARLAERLSNGRGSGKARHAALGMLDAWEWYQLIEMHFRHHLRQKARLDSFLGVTK